MAGTPAEDFSAAHAAAHVLRRSIAYLLRDDNLASSAYVATNLGRWARVLGEDWLSLLQDFDSRPQPEQQEALQSLQTRLDTLQSPPLPVFQERVRLLPEGIPLKAPVAAEVPAPPVVVEVPPAEPPVSETVEATPEKRPEGRRPRTEGREKEHRFEQRHKTKNKPPPEPPKEEVVEERAQENSVAELESKTEPPTEIISIDVDVKAEVKVEEPPKVIEVEEPRLNPLGHPEASGAPLSSLGCLKEEEIAALGAVGIQTVSDLLLRGPLSIDRAGERLSNSLPIGRVIVRGTIKTRATRFGPAGSRYEISLSQERGSIIARWVEAPEAEIRRLKPGMEIGLCGRLEAMDDQSWLYEPELLGVDGRGGDWLPRYEIPGLPEARMRTAMRAALQQYADVLLDHLPTDIIERFKLLPIGAALKDAHFPSNAARRGRSRMALDELLQVQLGIMLQQGRAQPQRGTAHPAVHGMLSRALGMAGWSLPDAQEAAFDEIRRDLRKATPMMRLLQGDVGTGKQAVIQAAMLSMAEGSHQSLLLAPDPLTAEHRYLFTEAFFRSVGIEPVLLSTPPTRAQIEALRRGDTLVAYGTHAAASALADCRKLGLLVIEDPGPSGFFDLSQIDALPVRPDVLVFTAMPVPSSVLLSVYGSLALTVLPSQPSQGAETVLVPSDQRDSAYAAAREVIANHQQVVVLLPLNRGQDVVSLSELRRLSESLSTDYLGGARVNIFHGAMSREERFRSYDDFQHRRADVLLATTFIEHGPAVPNVSMLIVESAEHFDGIRLHRLRGLVANGWWRGRALLITALEAMAPERAGVDLVVRETDGYRIAAAELRRLGLEATLGEGTEDLMEFSWGESRSEQRGEVFSDRDLLLRTRQEAVRLLALDPGLKRRIHRPLLYLVKARFGEETGSETPPPNERNDQNRRKRRRRR